VAKSRPDCTGKLGAVGFCFGGGVVNVLAVRMGADLDAGVPFYRNQPSAADVAKIKAPLLAHYSELDTRDYIRLAQPLIRSLLLQTCRMRDTLIVEPITASTTIRRLVTTKPRSNLPGSARWLNNTCDRQGNGFFVDMPCVLINVRF
jgi:hypothetical protein